MNTQINITVLSELGTINTLEKIDEAYSKFDYVVKHFSRFSIDSELGRFNRKTLDNISQELFDLIDFTIKLSKLTNFLYDPTIIDLLEAYGFNNMKNFDEKFSDKNLFESIQNIVKKRKKITDIKVDYKNKKIQLARNQRIDLGSIGKGYAIRLAKEALDCFDHFLIEAGGDIYAKGLNNLANKWKIALLTTDKQSNKLKSLNSVYLSNQSISSSGNWANKIRFFHHLINPMNGLSQNNGIKQTFVVGTDPLYTDAWATALYLMGQEGFELLKKQGMEGLIIDEYDTIISTPNFFSVCS